MHGGVSQLRLLPGPRPLDDRLGSSFFREVPHRPGVYRMFGPDGTLLYVGKAGDLRQRLNAYRSLTNASRKTIRLVHAVHAITWEVCASEEAAVLLENALLRTHRPRFNRAGVWPQANGYLELVCSHTGLRLRFVRPTADQDQAPGPFDAGPAPDRRMFGAFKPGARFACAALVRLLWGHREDWPEPARLPRSLLLARGTPMDTVSDIHPTTTELLAALLAGESPELLNRWVGFAEVPGSPFLRAFWCENWALAAEFYRTGPARNRAMRERFGVADTLIEQSELDDLLVRWRRV